MRNLSIGLRLSLSFGLVLVLTLAISGGGWWGLETTSRTARDMLEGDGAMAHLAESAHGRALELRRYEKDLLLNIGTPALQAEYLAKWREDSKQLRELLQQMAPLSDAEAAAVVRAASEGLSQYQLGFEQVAERARSGAIATPQAGNAEIAAFKEPIRSLIESTEKLAIKCSGRMSANGQVLEDLVRTVKWILFFAVLLAIGVGAVISVLMARSINVPLRRLLEVAEAVAAGDLTREIGEASHDELGRFATSFRIMVSRLREIVAALKHAEDDLAAVADEVTNATLSQRTLLSQQANAVSQTTEATRELAQASSMASTSADQVLAVAQRAGKISKDGQDAASLGLRRLEDLEGVVKRMIAQTMDLLERASDIDQVVVTVRDVADQSHLLSLNAAIEAERAGAAGAGFAVVASEIRSLAARSSEGTDRIQKVVTQMLRSVRATLAISEEGQRSMIESGAGIRASGESLRQLGTTLEETSSSAVQIAGAVHAQSSGVTQISAAMKLVDEGMTEAVDKLQGLEQAAGRLSTTAQQMAKIVSGLRA